MFIYVNIHHISSQPRKQLSNVAVENLGETNWNEFWGLTPFMGMSMGMDVHGDITKNSGETLEYTFMFCDRKNYPDIPSVFAKSMGTSLSVDP